MQNATQKKKKTNAFYVRIAEFVPNFVWRINHLTRPFCLVQYLSTLHFFGMQTTHSKLFAKFFLAGIFGKLTYRSLCIDPLVT
jgi:hypothetical protein